jgi:hypothetical protein
MNVHAWQRLAGYVGVAGLAMLLATVAFLYRFNALGGSLGGFDNDDFFVLTRADMVLDGQLPLRDFVDGELRGAWPSLSYAVPAWAQMIWGRNLFVIAALEVGALALAAAIVFLVARTLSRGWLIALLASAVVILSTTKLYNYPKVLSLAVAVAAIRWMLAKPTMVRLAVLAAMTVLTGLYRHDYALYCGLAAAAGLIALEPRPWPVPVRRVLAYVAFGLLFAVPSLWWVEREWGVGRYVRDALRASETEGLRLIGWPVVSLTAPLAGESPVAFTYYAYWGLPIAAAGVLLWHLFAARHFPSGRGDGMTPAVERGVGVALLVMTPLVNYFFLRNNLPARLGDAVVPVVLVAAWIAGTTRRFPSPVGRSIAFAATAAALSLMCVVFVRVNSVMQELRSGGLTGSAAAALKRFDAVRNALHALPPAEWADRDATGPMGAARYLAECSRPDDYVLVAAYTYEIPYFARRRFAGGQGLFSHGFFLDEAYQRLAVERLARQSVPIAFVDTDLDTFRSDYPLVAEHLARRYRDVGRIDNAGHPYVHVFVDAARRPDRLDPVFGLPCFR